jgi:hypothetical protein
MSGNTSQIFSKVGDVQWCSLTAANTALDGTGTVGTVFTSDATNGGRIERLRCMALGTNVASVARFFINNGSTNTTASNNVLIGEIALPATTAINTAPVTNVSQIYELPNNTIDQTAFPLVLPPGYKINVVIATAVSAGWAFHAPGGKY